MRSPLLTGAGFRHAFSRKPLDFGPGDDRARAAHLDLLARAVGFEPSALHQLDQVHGTRVVQFLATPEDPAAPREKGDAMFALATDNPIALGVRTADCVPIVVGNLATGAVAAIHAGWRGIVDGIIREAMTAFISSGDESARECVAAIGPAIGACCFEVDRSVADSIARASSDRRLVSTRGAKAFVDLRGAARDQLHAAGIRSSNIEDVVGCTKCDETQFFSFRRDGDASGRHLAVIVTRAR